MKSQYIHKIKLPDGPGVYFFKKGREILYIGKATSIRSRVKSYFGKDLIETRGPFILDMTFQSNKLDWHKTDSVLEALILEAELIKKYQPKYNTKEKDNKSFNYVCITKEELPQVLIVRGRNIEKEINSKRYQATYGPFTNGQQLREAMKIIRRIFPYIDAQSSKRNNFEFYRQLGLIPDITQKKTFQNVLARLPKTGTVGQGSPHRISLEARPDHFEKSFSASRKQYLKNISNLKLFFQGKKKRIITNLKKEMILLANKREFEKAGEAKRKIFALEHINDIALIKDDVQRVHTSKKYRIEAYDVAHMSGKNMVGVMVVVENGQVAKSEYKKFIIRNQTGSNDTGALEEILSRRLRHSEWGLPSLITVDGNTSQINVAKQVLSRYQFDIPIVAVVKDNHHKARAIMGDEAFIKIHKKSILLANSEAHRFAIAFHKQKRSKNFLK